MLELDLLTPIIITLLGAASSGIKKSIVDSLLGRMKPAANFLYDSGRKEAIAPAKKFLLGLSAVVFVFGISTTIRYWSSIMANLDMLIFSGWLFVTMLFGMAVQVIATNYRTKGKLFDAISWDQIIFPILFSVVVFYPIWALSTTSPKSFFVIHAAFLNGYFWESIVSAAKAPGSSDK